MGSESTNSGRVVLASDTSHLYANMEEGRPFPIVQNVADMLDGHKRLYQLAASPRHIVPGHDPLVMQRYRAPERKLEGVAVRLDAGAGGGGVKAGRGCGSSRLPPCSSKCQTFAGQRPALEALALQKLVPG